MDALGFLLIAWGSSPLARGTPNRNVPVNLDEGLIPARAGNTVIGVTAWTTPRAHPRSRGEHDEEWAESVRLSGSSPLARGTHRIGVPCSGMTGLIPARAGNT